MTTITCIPFGKARSSYGGKLTGRDGSGLGGLSDGQLVPCAPTAASPVTSASADARSARRRISACLSAES